MKKNIKITEKLSKAPYRGIMTEVAREHGVTPQAIKQAIDIHNNLRIIEIVSQKMSERRLRFQKAIGEMQAC